MFKNKITVIVGALILIGIIGTAGVLSWWNWATKPYSASGPSQLLTIAPGTTPVQLADELQQRQLIRSAWAFRYLIRLRQSDFKIFAGDYTVSPAMPPAEILKQILADQQATVRVTIPEGFTTGQIIDLFVQKGIGTKAEFTKVITQDKFAYVFLKGAPPGLHRLEGYLSPNTYFVDRDAAPHAVIDMLLEQFNKELTPSVQKQLAAMKLTVPQWVTLASMVEKEAEKPTDRPLIASVFLNRLKINMPLQSCATIQFLLGTPKPVLYDKDLQIPSPYNTYLHKGLPPGPISNPGEASLQAILHPAKTNYLYFVAKKDGYHAFAATYAEHLKNIKLYE